MKTLDVTITTDRTAATRWLMCHREGEWLTESMTPGLMAASLDPTADDAIKYAFGEHDRYVDNQDEGEF